MSIIKNRINNDLHTSFPVSQSAYQPGRGTTEQILGLQQLIEKSVEFNHILFLLISLKHLIVWTSVQSGKF